MDEITAAGDCAWQAPELIPLGNARDSRGGTLVAYGEATTIHYSGSNKATGVSA